MQLDVFDKPNPYGLRATDFNDDMRAYDVALGFLGDVSIGVDEEKALTAEGGTPEMMRSWEKSRRFRRALDECRNAGAAEREYEAAQQAARNPFGIPPRGGVDLAAATYEPDVEQHRGGLRGWLRRLDHAARQQTQAPRQSGGQRFIPISDLTPDDARTLGLQRDAELIRRFGAHSRNSAFSTPPDPASFPQP